MILVTGGTGLLGSHLVVKLLEKNEHVRVIIRSAEAKDKLLKVICVNSDNSADLLNKIDWFYGDILDKVSLNEAFEGIEKVYHCAAVVSFNKADRKSMLDCNIRGTANVVNACLEGGIKKLVHVSSIAAVKKSENGSPITEENQWPLGATLNYQYSKTQGEYEVWRGINEGLAAVIVNPSIILGGGEWNSGSAQFFSSVYNGLRFYTHGINGFVDVLDVADAMITLMESNIQGERFIVNSENLSYKDLFNLIADSLGVKRPDIYASHALTEIGWRLGWLKSKLLFSKPLFTKESARVSHSVQYYSSEKLVKAVDIKFSPIDKTLKRIAFQFLKDNRH